MFDHTCCILNPQLLRTHRRCEHRVTRFGEEEPLLLLLWPLGHFGKQLRDGGLHATRRRRLYFFIRLTMLGLIPILPDGTDSCGAAPTIQRPPARGRHSCQREDAVAGSASSSERGTLGRTGSNQALAGPSTLPVGESEKLSDSVRGCIQCQIRSNAACLGSRHGLGLVAYLIH